MTTTENLDFAIRAIASGRDENSRVIAQALAALRNRDALIDGRVCALEATATKRGTWRADGNWTCACAPSMPGNGERDLSMTLRGNVACHICGTRRPLPSNERPLPLAASPAEKACTCVPPYGRAFGGTDTTRCGDCGLPRLPAPAPPVATCAAVSPSTSQPCVLDAGHAGTHHKSAVDTRWNVDANPPVATAAVDVGALVASMREAAEDWSSARWRVVVSPSGKASVYDDGEAHIVTTHGDIAAHIAAACPANVIAILDAYEASERTAEYLRGKLVQAQTDAESAASALRSSEYERDGLVKETSKVQGEWSRERGRAEIAEVNARNATRDLALERAAVERLTAARDALLAERDTAVAALGAEVERSARLVIERDEARRFHNEADVDRRAWHAENARLSIERDEALAQFQNARQVIAGGLKGADFAGTMAVNALEAKLADANAECCRLRGEIERLTTELERQRAMYSAQRMAERTAAPADDTLAAAQLRYDNARSERDALDAEVKRLRTQAVGT